MSFTALVTDSTTTVSQEFREYGVRVIPLHLKMGETSYRDGVDITPEQFYERLPKCATLPTTSQPSAGDFAAIYRELIEKGASGIISVHLSSGLSGTINSAHLAAEQVSGVPIEIIDTQTLAVAVTLAVESGARALRGGASMSEAVAAIRKVIAAQKLVFTVDTLEYLYKGGRIGGAAALVGSLLQFKPLLYFKEGKIDALERVRRSSRASQRMVELMADWLGKEQPLYVRIMQAACQDRAEALAETARQQLNVADLQISPLTPVLGAHGGPGTLGICCCPVSACV